MDTRSCFCKKCKGKIVSRKTFQRHLLKGKSLQNNIFISLSLLLYLVFKDFSNKIIMYTVYL